MAVDFQLRQYTPSAGGSTDFILQEIGGPHLPRVNAGANVGEHVSGIQFSRTATEDDGGSVITARAWTVATGPAEVGTTLSTAALLEWTPTTEGAYTLRYSATNAIGTDSDDLTITVGAGGEIDLFFIGGQSNALYRDVGGDAPNPIPGTAYDYHWSGALTAMDDLPGGFGPAFAVEWYAQTGRVSVYHNKASGASAQQYVVSPSNNWSDQTPNEYTQAVSAWNAAISNLESLGYTVRLRGLLWDQGGQDALFMDPPDNLGSAAGYETQFLAMIARLRAEYGAGFKVWIVRLGRVKTAPDNEYWNAIRDKQAAVVAADPDVHFMHTEAATWDGIYYYDNLHYSQDGYDKIGTEGAQVVAAELGLDVGTTLTVQDASHGHTADAPALTQAATLAVADAAHAHTAASPALVQGSTLAVADTAHAHAADSPALVQAHALAVADASHGHTADTPTLAVAGSLAVQSATHGHTAEAPSLVQAHTLTVADAVHGHSADSPVLSFGAILTVSDALHAHTAGTPTLTLADVLAVADALHSHTADSPSLVQANVLAVADALHGHTADTVVLGGFVEITGPLTATLTDSRRTITLADSRLTITLG